MTAPAPTRPQEARHFMPDPFDPIALVIAKAQAEDRAAEDLKQERAQKAQDRAARRHLKPSPRNVTAGLTAGRQQARDARAYAEQWYRMLTEWRTREVKITGSFHYDDGGFDGATTLGGRPLPTTYLTTPIGELDERNVGQTITDMSRAGTVEARHLGKLLDKLRHAQHLCPTSLLHGNGRGWSGEAGIRYGVAVLTLAVRLGDSTAELHLPHVRRALTR